MPTEAERLATMEEAIRSLRDDVKKMSTEETRTRDRLHKLEGTTAALVQLHEARAADAERLTRKTQTLISACSLVLALLVVLAPLLLTRHGR